MAFRVVTAPEASVISNSTGNEVIVSKPKFWNTVYNIVVESPHPPFAPTILSFSASVWMGEYSSAPISGLVVDRVSPSMSVVTPAIGVPILLAPVIKCKSSLDIKFTGPSSEFAL